jgi:sec-independent protein translocase protein TatA
MPSLGGWEWVILIALILLLFGAKRLPDAARGLGRSLRIFKSETKGLIDDVKSEAAPVPSEPATTVAAAEAPAPAASEVTTPPTATAPERTES